MDLLDTTLLAQQLRDFAPILAFDTVSSTQTALADHLVQQRGIPGQWHLAIADQQTAGRGRTGAQWHAQPGEALLLTLATQLPLAPPLWPRASLIAGLAVAETLGQHVRLKWPNDLLIQQKNWLKLGGILCERLETPQGPWWLCGLGLNLRGVPTGLEMHAAALESLKTREELAVRLIRQIQQEIQQFVLQQGNLPLDRLHARLAFQGEQVEMSDQHAGILHGLAHDGGLRVGERVLHAGSIVRAPDFVAQNARQY